MGDPLEISKLQSIISHHTQLINEISQIQKSPQKNESYSGVIPQTNTENLQVNKSQQLNENFQYSKSQSNNESFSSCKNYQNKQSIQGYRSITKNESTQRFKYSEFQSPLNNNRQLSNENPNTGLARRMNDNSLSNGNSRYNQYDTQQGKYYQDNQRRNIRHNMTNKFSDQNNQYPQTPFNYQMASNVNGKISTFQTGNQFSYNTGPKFAQNSFIFLNQMNTFPPLPPLPKLPINGLLLHPNQNKQQQNTPLNPQINISQLNSHNDENGNINQNTRRTNYKQYAQTFIENIDHIVENPLVLTEFYQEKLQKQLQESIEKIDNGDLKHFQIDISEQDNCSPFEYLKQFRLDNNRSRSVTEDYIDIMANIDLYTEKLYYAIQDKAADHLRINNYNPQTLLQNNNQSNNYHSNNFQSQQQQQQQNQSQRETARSIIKGAVKSVLDYNENRTVIPRYARESDWLCQCGNLNFSYRESCNKCQLIKPKYQYAKNTDLYQQLDEMEKQVLNIDSKVSQQSDEQIITQQRQIVQSDFIWICKCCRSINYSKTATCLSCNMYKMIDRNKLIEITKNSQKKLAKYAQKLKEKHEKTESELEQVNQQQKPKDNEIQEPQGSKQTSIDQNNEQTSQTADQTDQANISIDYNSLNNSINLNHISSPIEYNLTNTSTSYNLHQNNFNISSDNLQISQENLNTSVDNLNSSVQIFDTFADITQEKFNTPQQNSNSSKKILNVPQENFNILSDKMNSPQNQNKCSQYSQKQIIVDKINQKEKENIFILDKNNQSCEADYSESDSSDISIQEVSSKAQLIKKKCLKSSILKSSKLKSKKMSSQKKNNLSILEEINESPSKKLKFCEDNIQLNENDESLTYSLNKQSQEFEMHLNAHTTDDSYDCFQYIHETNEQEQIFQEIHFLDKQYIENAQNYIQQKKSVQNIPISLDIQDIKYQSIVHSENEDDQITNSKSNSIQEEFQNIFQFKSM